jgi:hypothetical protein
MAYISRTKAVKKYRVSYDRLRQLEREGKLQKYAASDVKYEDDKPTRGGQTKWVYKEDDVAKAARTNGDVVRFARNFRKEAVVFDMLSDGRDLIEIVRRTRFSLAEVTQLRNVYLREKGLFVVPREAIELAAEHGIELKHNTIGPLLVRLLEAARANNRAKPKRKIPGLVEE